MVKMYIASQPTNIEDKTKCTSSKNRYESMMDMITGINILVMLSHIM